MYGCSAEELMLSNCGAREDSWEIKPVNPKGNQLRIFTGRTDPEAEVPIFWPPDGKSRLTGKDLNPGENWKQQEKWAAEDDMVR